MQQISSIPSHLADSPRATEVFTQGSFCSPHGSSSQIPWTPVDLQPCPRYETKQPGLSVWFSVCLDGHRLVSSLPNSFKWLPYSSGRPWTWGSLPCASAPSAPGAGWSHVLSSFFPLPPCPFFPLSYQVLYGSGYSFSVVRDCCQYSIWSSVRTAASLDLLDASWGKVYPTSTYPSINLSTPICGCIRKELPFLLSNITITTHV